MGFILSKFRRSKPATKDLLEQIDKELRNIQRFQVDTELQQKKIIGRLIIFSAIGYVLSAVVFYFLAPRGLHWKDQLINVAPFVAFPLLMLAVKRFVTWYYQQKIVKKKERYAELKKDKQRILEDVMDNETFKVGKEILEKYAPSQLLPKHLSEQLQLQGMSPVPLQPTPGVGQRLAAFGTTPTQQGFNDGLRRRQQQGGRPSIGGASSTALMSTPIRSQPQRPPQLQLQQFAQQQQQQQQQQSRTGSAIPPNPSYMLPLPPSNPVVHNRSMGWMDKLVEYVIGDGPSTRFALICRYCATHNGLATAEEFPYLGFRCAFCKQFNPPRQVRAAAPKLPTNTVLIEEMESTVKTLGESTDSDGEKDSNKGQDKDQPTQGHTEDPSQSQGQGQVEEQDDDNKEGVTEKNENESEAQVELAQTTDEEDHPRDSPSEAVVQDQGQDQNETQAQIDEINLNTGSGVELDFIDNDTGVDEQQALNNLVNKDAPSDPVPMELDGSGSSTGFNLVDQESTTTKSDILEIEKLRISDSPVMNLQD